MAEKFWLKRVVVTATTTIATLITRLASANPQAVQLALAAALEVVAEEADLVAAVHPAVALAEAGNAQAAIGAPEMNSLLGAMPYACVSMLTQA